MVVIAHSIAVLCYLGAAALAAAPFARPVRAPLAAVRLALGAGVLAHVAALAALATTSGRPPLTGLGPALSFAGLVLAATLLLVEVLAREASLTLVAAPLAAIPTTVANVIGMRPLPEPTGVQGAWLYAHVALSFVGIAAFATAAAAGLMYLIQRRELRSRRFGALFRFFPPLETLDRVNHVSAVAGWLGMTLGVVLAVTYMIAYRRFDIAQMAWGLLAWAGVTAVALGRVLGGWQARRAAVVSSISFAAVVACYVVVRVATGDSSGGFL